MWLESEVSLQLGKKVKKSLGSGSLFGLLLCQFWLLASLITLWLLGRIILGVRRYSFSLPFRFTIPSRNSGRDYRLVQCPQKNVMDLRARPQSTSLLPGIWPYFAEGTGEQGCGHQKKSWGFVIFVLSFYFHN